MIQAYVPSIAFYEVRIERGTSRVDLRVPHTLHSMQRRDRLLDLLRREHWTVVAVGAIVGVPEASTPKQGQAEELRFVRDCLSIVRLRQGNVPEKVAAKLLEVGVKGLHERCLALFGKSWKAYLEARCEPAGFGPVPAGFILDAPPGPAPEHPLPVVVAPAPPALAPPPAPVAPVLAAPVAPPAPLPLVPALASAASEVEQEADSLMEMLLGGGGSCDSDLDTLLTGTGCGLHLDMSAAVELDAASAPATPEQQLLPAPAAAPTQLLLHPARPASSTLTTAATGGVGEPQSVLVPLSPAHSLLLDQLAAELWEPAAQLPPYHGRAITDIDTLLSLPIPDMRLPLCGGSLGAGFNAIF